MDWNEYVVAQMVKDRLAEASATAERQALLRALDPGPGALRVSSAAG